MKTICQINWAGSLCYVVSWYQDSIDLELGVENAIEITEDHPLITCLEAAGTDYKLIEIAE